MAAFSGKFARITVDGLNLIATRWSINFKADELDTSQFRTAGSGDWRGGVQDADISFDAFWDSLVDPHATPPNLRPGTTHQIILNPSIGDVPGSAYIFETAFCFTVMVDAEVRGLVKYSVTARNAAGRLGGSRWTYTSGNTLPSD